MGKTGFINIKKIVRKYLFRSIFILSIISIISACNQQRDTELIISDQVVCLKVGKNTTKSELEKIAAELLVRKNIAIDFSKSTFTKEGRIKVLDLYVDCRDGSTGQCTAPVSNLFTQGRYGFRRNYSPGAAVLLEMCCMD